MNDFNVDIFLQKRDLWNVAESLSWAKCLSWMGVTLKSGWRQ